MAALPRTTAAARVPPRALVLASALPLLLLHGDYQPGLSLGLGGTTVDVELSDLAVAAVLAAALVAVRRGARANGLRLLLPGALFLAAAVAGIAVGTAQAEGYATAAHIVTALVWIEYASLAVAVPLLVRDAASLRVVLWTLAAALAVFDAIALLQFAGARQPSLVGFHDLGAAGGVALSVGLAAAATRPPWASTRLLSALCATGAVGTILAGSVAAALGLVVALAVVLGAGRAAGVLGGRRAAALTALAAVTVLGVVLLRGGDLGQFARFVGLLPPERTTTEDVQTYSHRTLLGYLGLRVALEHPVVGAGWQATTQYETLAPYVPDARRRFPDVAEQAFPRPDVAYGVQNAYVQALADLGPVGLLAFAGALLVPLAAGARAAARGSAAALAGAAALAVCAGVWTALGLVGGIATLALTALAAGLVVASWSARLDV